MDILSFIQSMHLILPATVELDNTEFNTTNPNDMWAEGTSELIPNDYDIVLLVYSQGYQITKEPSVWYDTLMGIYRWTAPIVKSS